MPRLGHIFTRMTFSKCCLLVALWCAMVAVCVAAEGDKGEKEKGDAEKPKSELEKPSITSSSIEDLPKFGDMHWPTTEEILTGKHRDWVVLSSSHVVIVEPVSPRPETMGKLRAIVTEKEREKKGLKGPDLELFQRELEELKQLYVTLPGEEDNPEYRIPLVRIKEIICFEDQALRRVGQLITAKEFGPAREILFRVKATYPDWPGVEDRHKELLLAEAQALVKEQQLEKALLFLEELYGKDSEYVLLKKTVGEVIDRLISEASQNDQPLRARYFLDRLERMYSDHEVVRKQTANLIAKTEQLIQEGLLATRNHRPAEGATLAEKAALVWPKTVAGTASYKQLMERYQRLKVGVVDFSPEAVSLLPPPAGARNARLQSVPLFEIQRMTSGVPHYRSRLFDEWEPLDLGRRMRFTLRRTRQPWEAISFISAPTICEAIEERLDPHNAKYDERLASSIRAVELTSPTEFSLLFSRVPPRVEPMLAQVTVELSPNVADRSAIRTPSEQESSNANVLIAERSATLGGFVIAQQEPERLVQQRFLVENDGLAQYHVAEIIERKYSTPDRMGFAFAAGETLMLPDAPDWVVRRLQENETVVRNCFFLKYALPTTHLLVVNPQSAPLQIRELRRAMSLAVDREGLLKTVVLRDPNLAHGRMATGPFSESNYGFDHDVKPVTFDLSAATALKLAAEKQFDQGLPALRFAVPFGSVERAAAEKMVQTWKRIGIEVKLVEAVPAQTEGGQQSPPTWDLRYVLIQSADPASDWPKLLTALPNPRTSDLLGSPDWVRRDLFDLDRQSDWGRTVASVRVLHRRLASDVRTIPLWEVDQFLIIRKLVRNVPARPWHCYDQIDRWTVEAPPPVF